MAGVCREVRSIRPKGIWPVFAFVLFAALGFVLMPAQSAGAAPSAPSAEPNQPPPRLQQAAEVPSCPVGAYLLDLYDLNWAEKTFRAEVWLFTTCKDHRKTLQRMGMLNATEYHTEHFGIYPRPQGLYWSQVKLVGTFRTIYHLDDYPFDQHRLTIDIEDVELDSTKFRYLTDKRNVNYNHNIEVQGYKIKGYQVTTGLRKYESTFADPLLIRQKDSTYSRLRITVDLEHVETLSFIKLVTPAYVAFAFTLLALFIRPKNAELMLGRMGLLGGFVFVVVLNMQAAGSTLGVQDGFSLVEQLHVITMLTILLCAIVTHWLWHRTETLRMTIPIAKANVLSIIGVLILFVAANAAAIWLAMQ